MNQRFIWDKETKAFVDITNYRKAVPESKGPMVVPDSMPVATAADGTRTDSWSKWKRIGKRYGDVVHISEAQQDDPSKRYKQMSESDYEKCAHEAAEQVRYGMHDSIFTEYDREVCKRVNERLKNRA